tara:strand:+ start:2227 stop:3570 length:1344 start_codon:yes stop_codon:yes gene_type:complete
MAYKFQVGGAALSGSIQLLDSSTDFQLKNDAGNNAVHLRTNSEAGQVRVRNSANALTAQLLGATGVLSGSGAATTNGLTVGGTSIISASRALAGVTTLSGSGALSCNGLNIGGAALITVGGAISSPGIISGSGVATLGGLSVGGAAVINASLALANIASCTVDGAISGSGALSALGALAIDGTSTLNGQITLAGADEVTMDVSVDSMYIRDGDGTIRRDTLVDYATKLAGTTANSALVAASGVLSLDINSVTAAAIASTDTLLFNDQTGDVVRQESIDDIATLFAGDGLSAASAVMALDLNELTAAAVDVASDSIAIVDATDNTSKKESIADLVSAMAGAGLVATAGQLSTDGATVTGFGDENRTMSVGFNYASASLTAARTYTLPASPSVGDVVHIKMKDGVTTGDYAKITGSAAQTIDGASVQYIYSEYGAISLVFAAASDWRIW